MDTRERGNRYPTIVRTRMSAEMVDDLVTEARRVELSASEIIRRALRGHLARTAGKRLEAREPVEAVAG